MKCLRCGTELPTNPTKEWTYRSNYYLVKSYRCPNCSKYTNVYYHDGMLSHTIPKQPRQQKEKYRY